MKVGPDKRDVAEPHVIEKRAATRLTCRLAWQSDLGVGLEFVRLSDPLRLFIARAADGEAAELLKRVQAVTLSPGSGG